MPRAVIWLFSFPGLGFTARMNEFDLAGYLQDGRQWVEAALQRLVPPADTRPARLHEAMHYSLFAGGKRIRPILCAACAEACGAPRLAAEYPSTAIECLHTYTLIHDDLPCMDDDALRRGRPTCHVVFGEAVALLAGDALQALAFQLAAETPIPDPLALVKELADAAGSTAVVGGQVEDMLGEQLPPDEERLRYIQRHKTGDLIRCACRMGALTAEAPEAVLDAATAYADAIGEAFQVADDLLNVESTAEKLGKAVGRDAERGKTTAVSVYGVKGARERLAALIEQAAAVLPAFPGDAVPLAALARYVGSREN